MTFLALALDENALDLQLIDFLLALIWSIQVDNGKVIFVQRRIGTTVKITYSALECIQIIVVFVCKLERLVQLFPETACSLLQVGKLGVSIDPERRGKRLYVCQICLVARVKVKQFDLNGFHDLFGFLDCE